MFFPDLKKTPTEWGMLIAQSRIEEVLYFIIILLILYFFYGYFRSFFCFYINIYIYK